jgi:stringent starvation protein B
MTTAVPTMTPTKPYLIRAIYDWIIDNRCTPYILVDANRPNVRVPPSAIKDGQVVLNLAPRAVDRLDLGLDDIRFNARFSGISHQVVFPLGAVLAIYAQENGQGMMFPPDESEAPAAVTTEPAAEPEAPKPLRERPALRIVK